MKEYSKQYNSHDNGLYVKIMKGRIEIFSKMYTDIAEAELYYHKIHIEPDRMTVTLRGFNKEILTVIHNAKRIYDMR